MAVTMRQIRASLEADELDYVRAKQFGEEALPHLVTLVESSDPVLGPRAVYLAVEIGGRVASEVVRSAASSREPMLRLSLAGAARGLEEPLRSELVLTLLTEPDRGVRKLALDSLDAHASPEVRTRVHELSKQDADPGLRRRAREVLARIGG